LPERLPLTLRAYALLTAAATPLVQPLLNRRLRRGKEHPQRMAERRGEAAMARPAGVLVWVHGASVGELVAAMPLIARIRARAFNVLVTTGTVTSAALAEKRLPPDVIHQFVPLDAPAFVAKFLDHWRPSLALLVESDLWPNTIMGCARRRIPLIVVNGRLSARSFKRWRYFPSTIEALLRRLDLCLVRTAADAARFGALGAPRVTHHRKPQARCAAAAGRRAQARQAHRGDRWPAGGCRRFHPPGRGGRGHRHATAAQSDLPRLADDPRSPPS